MNRYRDSRSPSPAGSGHSSKRLRRDDDGRLDRDRRDNSRIQRRRSRSRSIDVSSPCSQMLQYLIVFNQQRRYDRDRRRDPRRADRSTERRQQDSHRIGRRDRSRDRGDRYDRERSPDRRPRQNRDRDRDRDYRDRRDDSYSFDKGGRHRGDSTDSWSRSRGDGNAGKPSPRIDDTRNVEVSRQNISSKTVKLNYSHSLRSLLQALYKPQPIRRQSGLQSLLPGNRKLLRRRNARRKILPPEGRESCSMI